MGTVADPDENPQIRTVWGKTRGRNIPPEIVAKAADAALAAYLETIAESLAAA